MVKRPNVSTIVRSARAWRQRAARRRLTLRVTDRQVTEPTIYFMAPDFNHPFGGNRVIYRHVDILRAADIPAAVLHQKANFRYTWFASNTPVTDATTTPVGPEDLLVVPEVDVDVLVHRRAYPRHVVLNQNGYLTWVHDSDAVTAHYRSHRRPLAIVTTSQHTSEFARYAFPHLDVRQVCLSVDPDHFTPAEEEAPPRIAYMPRRGAADAAMVLRMLKTRDRLGGWEVRALSGLTEKQVAAELRSARVFLATSPREGFGLPPLEAMASGCYVVGYDAIGGKEFMRPEFSSPIEAGNVLRVAQAVETVLDRDVKEPGWLRTRGLSAALFVHSRYSPKREQEGVLAAYGDLLNASK
jgi:Glycosyl transferases group 1